MSLNVPGLAYLTYNAAYQLLGNTHLVAALRPVFPVSDVAPVVDLTVSQLCHGC